MTKEDLNRELNNITEQNFCYANIVQTYLHHKNYLKNNEYDMEIYYKSIYLELLLHHWDNF